jgi:shikimate 5-dehydrogenase
MHHCITGTTIVVGVRGDPIAHRLSPLMHHAACVAESRDWIDVACMAPHNYLQIPVPAEWLHCQFWVYDVI